MLTPCQQLRGQIGSNLRGNVGRIALARGEGLVGWSALTRKPAMVRERAMEDPRFCYFPELEEERYQAMLTVPMTGADGTVVAVISLHTVAPQEFTDEHARVVAAMAPILGGAIETSGLYESTVRKLTVLSTLSGLAQTVRSGRHLDDALRMLAETAARVTASDLCVVTFAEPGVERLAVRAYRPGAGDATGTSHIGTVERQLWERLAASTSPAELGLTGDPRSMPQAAEASAASGGSGPAPPGAQAYGAQMVAPPVAAGEQLGVMACYSTLARQYAEDDVALLDIIANQAAIAIQNSQLADLLAERDAPARLFRDLMQGPEEGEELVRRRAALLGCDLSRLHVPVILDLGGEVPRSESRDAARQFVAGLVHRPLGETYPGSLVHTDTASSAWASCRSSWASIRRQHALAGPAHCAGSLARAGAISGPTARRAGASTIVVGRSSAGRLNRLLRGPDPARTLLDCASCTLIAGRD